MKHVTFVAPAVAAAILPVEGLGDRAYVGPVGSFYYVRKGPALITFGLSMGTREQAIALARRIVSRI